VRRAKTCRQEPQTIALGIPSVNERVLAEIGKAGILQRLTRTIRQIGAAVRAGVDSSTKRRRSMAVTT
jgi:hypothetical protein